MTGGGTELPWTHARECPQLAKADAASQASMGAAELEQEIEALQRIVAALGGELHALPPEIILGVRVIESVQEAAE